MNTSPGTPPTSKSWTSLLCAIRSVRRGLSVDSLRSLRALRPLRRLRRAATRREVRGPYRVPGPVEPVAAALRTAPAQAELEPRVVERRAQGSQTGASAVFVLNGIVLTAILCARALAPTGASRQPAPLQMPVHLHQERAASIGSLDARMAPGPGAVRDSDFGARPVGAPPSVRR